MSRIGFNATSTGVYDPEPVDPDILPDPNPERDPDSVEPIYEPEPLVNPDEPEE